MSTKLTLTIDKDVIEKAKSFAKQSNRSLSEIIESYLAKITSMEDAEVDSELEKIKGIISLPSNFNEKKAVRDILSKKHN